jgi:hypothetical protein
MALNTTIPSTGVSSHMFVFNNTSFDETPFQKEIDQIFDPSLTITSTSNVINEECLIERTSPITYNINYIETRFPKYSELDEGLKALLLKHILRFEDYLTVALTSALK